MLNAESEVANKRGSAVKLSKFVLTSYGMPHVMGYLATRDGKLHPSPLVPVALMDFAVESGLGGVEFPLGGATADTVETLRDALQSRNLSVVADYMVIIDGDVEDFRIFLRNAAKLRAKVARAIMSKILC